MPTVEDQLAAALATVPGLEARPFRPRLIHAGSAWPEWASAMPLTDCAMTETFDCLIALNETDQTEMARTRRRLIPQVVEALRDVGAYITGSGPVRITLDPGNPAGGIPGFRVSISITTEEDTP